MINNRPSRALKYLMLSLCLFAAIHAQAQRTPTVNRGTGAAGAGAGGRAFGGGGAGTSGTGMRQYYNNGMVGEAMISAIPKQGGLS